MSVEPELHVLEDPERAVAEVLADAARRGATIGLTGGHSVGNAYEQAAALEPDWSRAEVWWGDERCVPPEDERSNFLLAQRTLLTTSSGRPRCTASAASSSRSSRRSSTTRRSRASSST